MSARLLAVAGCAASAVLAAVPAPADAELWKGKTTQGRPASVRTGADTIVNRVRIRWKARCQGSTRTGQTVFTPPLDSAGARAFADAGTSRFNLGGGVRSRDTVSVNGTLGDDGRWRGRFRMRSVLRRNGEVVDRCGVGPIRWRARPVRQ
jgi:hypothetical protein